MTQNGPYPGRSSQPWSDGGADEPYQEPADPWGGGWGGQPQSVPPHQGGSYQPGAEYTAPAAEYTAPPSEYTAPASEYTAPASEYIAPAPDYIAPAPDYAAPAPGYTAPASEYTAPAETSGEWSPGGRPPLRRSPRRAPIAALVALSGLLVCGGLGTSAWLLMRDPEPKPTPAVGAPAPAPTTTAGPTTPTGSAPAPPLSTKDARFVVKGQCVRNDGTADVPEMSISVCASGAYEVLARFDGRTTGEADAEAKCSKVQNYSKWYLFDSELDSLDFVLCLKER